MGILFLCEDTKMAESAQKPLSMEVIEAEVGIMFPASCKQMLIDQQMKDAGQVKEYNLDNCNSYTEWSIRFLHRGRPTWSV
ncbi:hypothetical protein [Paenibacillus dendritiformis]|uniref:hypothetical protein n=1 Tax=Paenibacillus dendritiformis TaxID=130049 RepID=UPI00387E035B